MTKRPRAKAWGLRRCGGVNMETVNNMVVARTDKHVAPVDTKLALADLMKCPNLQRRMMVNAALVAGRVECRTKKRVAMAEQLVKAGQLALGGTISSGEGHRWYVPSRALRGTPTIGGPWVWFKDGPLEALETGLERAAPEKFGKGDCGAICFEHPNTKLMRGWLYIKVESKVLPGTYVYVPADPSLLDLG